jgi:hypothetical protein
MRFDLPEKRCHLRLVKIQTSEKAFSGVFSVGFARGANAYPEILARSQEV